MWSEFGPLRSSALEATAVKILTSHRRLGLDRHMPSQRNLGQLGIGAVPMFRHPLTRT